MGKKTKPNFRNSAGSAKSTPEVAKKPLQKPGKLQRPVGNPRAQRGNK